MVKIDQGNNNPAIMVEHLKVWCAQMNNVPKWKVNKDNERATGPSPFHQLWDDDKNVMHERGNPLLHQSSDDNLDDEEGGWHASFKVTSI
jgi:hypothetical protein